MCQTIGRVRVDGRVSATCLGVACSIPRILIASVGLAGSVVWVSVPTAGWWSSVAATGRWVACDCVTMRGEY